MIDVNELKAECSKLYEEVKKKNKKKSELYKQAFNELLSQVHGKKNSSDVLDLFKV